MIIKTTTKAESHFVAIVCLVILCLVCSCANNGNYLERRDAFTSMFSAGMSRYEVEQKLHTVQGVSFIEERRMGNDLALVFRVPQNDWGASAFVFRFDPDETLIVVFPIVGP